MTRLIWTAVEPEVRSVFSALSAVLDHDCFYLAGGTALAILEGHRSSVDLDLFTDEMNDPERLLSDLERNVAGIDDVGLGPGAVYLTIRGVAVSVIVYRYPSLVAPAAAEAGLLPLAHRDDIAAMKLAAVTNRGTRKDFVDLWTLISKHHSLDHYLAAFRRKFGRRDVGHVLRSLCYFDDADDDPPLRLMVDVDWELIKQQIRSWVAAAVVPPPQ